MPNVDLDAEHARLKEAIPRHIRRDGTINYTSLGVEFDRHRSNMKRKVDALGVTGALGTSPVIPGFGIKSVSTQYRSGAMVGESIRQVPLGDQSETVPKGFAIKGVSTLRDAHGNTIAEWTKTREEGPSVKDLIEITKRAFENWTPAALPAPLQNLAYSKFLTVYPVSDLHVGMFSWGKETDKDWDLKIAERVIVETVEKVHLGTPPTDEAVVLFGGDAVHSDTRNNMTEASGNILQVDGRYDLVVATTERIMVRTVDLALLKHKRVIVRVLKGNHDYHTAVALAHFLKAWYRREPRVEVDTSPSLFWFHQFGKVFLSAHHGHETKGKDMPMKMAVVRPEIWGSTKHRYALMFHIHHSERIRDTVGGVIVESFEVPCPPDDWHYGKSFHSGRSLCSITYDPESGEDSRKTVNL